jgi:hypothetical protein
MGFMFYDKQPKNSIKAENWCNLSIFMRFLFFGEFCTFIIVLNLIYFTQTSALNEIFVWRFDLSLILFL